MKAGVFIDGAYLSHILKDQYNLMKINHHKFARWAARGYELFRAYYYDCLPYQSPVPTEEEQRRLAATQRFFDALRSGERFTVREGTFEYRGQTAEGDPIFQQKRVDLQMGLDIATLVAKNRIDAIVLVSGDSDFVPVINLAFGEGILSRLVHGASHTYHSDLWRACDERLEMTEGELSQLLL